MKQTGNSMKPLRSMQHWQNGKEWGSHRHGINIRNRGWGNRIFTDECRQRASWCEDETKGVDGFLDPGAVDLRVEAVG